MLPEYAHVFGFLAPSIEVSPSSSCHVAPAGASRARNSLRVMIDGMRSAASIHDSSHAFGAGETFALLYALVTLALQVREQAHGFPD
jgi:hypothetical protein